MTGHGGKGQKVKEDWIGKLTALGYSVREADQAAEKIEKMAPQLRRGLEQWFQTGQLADISAGGFTAAELTEQRGMTVPAAFLVMDWYLREPEEAGQALASMPDQVIAGHV